jgi:hypothetical protein
MAPMTPCRIGKEVNPMRKRSILWFIVVSIFLVVSIILMTPSEVKSGSRSKMDDALLLMFASQSRLHQDEYNAISLHVPGTASIPLDYRKQGASKNQINEKKLLADTYIRWSNQLPSSNPASDYFNQKAEKYLEQAEELAQARRRYLRNHNNIFGGVRRLGQAVAKPVLKLGQAVFRGGRWVFRGMGDIGRVVVIIAKDEVIIRAKEIIRAKVQDLVDIGRGKLDAVVTRIARKAGWPVAELFREIVLDPAFKHLDAVVQKNINKILGSQASSGSVPAPTVDESDATPSEHDTDWESVNEEGDTGYDDADENEEEVNDATSTPDYEAGDGSEEEEDNPLELTPEELANQGYHEYTCGEFGEKITVTFSKNTLTLYYHWTHPMEIIYQKVEPNVYTRNGKGLIMTGSGWEHIGGGTCIRQ